MGENILSVVGPGRKKGVPGGAHTAVFNLEIGHSWVICMHHDDESRSNEKQLPKRAGLDAEGRGDSIGWAEDRRLSRYLHRVMETETDPIDRQPRKRMSAAI